jgi:hypothetical protein
MVQGTGKPAAAKAARTHTKTEATEDGSDDAIAGWNSVKGNVATGEGDECNDGGGLRQKALEQIVVVKLL